MFVYHQNPFLSLVAKFACFNVAVKYSAVNLLNFWVVVYLLCWGISYSTVVRVAVVVKLAILSISPLTSSVVVIVKLVTSGILSLLSLILAL